MGHFILAAMLGVASPIEVTPESLEGFQLISQPAEAPPVYDPTHPDPTLFWRWVGYATYATCGGLVPSSVEYRKYRSEWTAPVNNTVANYSMWFGTSVGMNSLSDWQRRSERSDVVAAFMRIGTLAACGYTSGNNFYQGWRQR